MNYRRFSLQALVLVVGVMALAVCGAAAGERGMIRSARDLEGKRLGVLSGTMLDIAANNFLDLTQFVYYDDSESQVKALLSGEIDAFLDDEPVARFLASSDSRLAVVSGKLMEDEYGFAMRKSDVVLYERINKELRSMMTDGTVTRLEKKWLDSTDPADRIMPPASDRKSGRVLRMGVSPVSAPFVYSVNGKAVGLDIELMQILVERLGMRLEVREMEFSELISSLQDEEVDIVGSCMSITEERKQIVRFTDSYYKGGVTAVTRAKS